MLCKYFKSFIVINNDVTFKNLLKEKEGIKKIKLSKKEALSEEYALFEKINKAYLAEINSLNNRKSELESKAAVKSDQQMKVEALLNSEEKLKKMYEEKKYLVEQQEKLIYELKKKYQEKTQSELSEKNSLQEEINRLNEYILEKTEQIKALDKFSIEKKKEEERKKREEKAYEPITLIQEKKTKKVRKVLIDDVRHTSHEIKLRFNFCFS